MVTIVNLERFISVFRFFLHVPTAPYRGEIFAILRGKLKN
jgi:hypothetical protein